MPLGRLSNFSLCNIVPRGLVVTQMIQRLCSSSPARAPPLTGVTRLPFASVWHLPGDGKWKFQSKRKNVLLLHRSEVSTEVVLHPVAPTFTCRASQVVGDEQVGPGSTALRPWHRCGMPLFHIAYCNSNCARFNLKRRGFCC